MRSSMDKSQITPEALEVLNKPGQAVWGSLLPDGSPHAAVAGFVVDGNQLVTHTAPTAQRLKNLRRDPRINVLVVDKDNPLKYVEIRGTAEIREASHADIGPLFKAQNDKYGLPPQASEPREGVIIVQIRVTPQKVNYFFFDPRNMGPKSAQQGAAPSRGEAVSIPEPELDAVVQRDGDDYFFEFERTLAHPAAAVFAALTQTRRLAIWEHPAEYFPALEEGATIYGHLNPQVKAVALGKVLHVEPSRRFTFRWTTNNPGLPPEFTLDFRLQETDGATRLNVRFGPFGVRNQMIPLIASTHIHLSHLEEGIVAPESVLPSPPWAEISVVTRDGRMLPMAKAYERKVRAEFPELPEFVWPAGMRPPGVDTGGKN
jgi:PPOX class probable F420-dependent enzyme